MLTHTNSKPNDLPRSFGYVLLYHNDVENVCPGCGQRQWLIGGLMAECAFCSTALPLARDKEWKSPVWRHPVA